MHIVEVLGMKFNTNYFSGEHENNIEQKMSNISAIRPREKAPQPTDYEPLDLSFSPIPQKKPEKNVDDHLDISSDESVPNSDKESELAEILVGGICDFFFK